MVPPSSHNPGSTRDSVPVVVLVHFGAAGTTRRCLEALARHEPEPHRVVVVDHGPPQNLMNQLRGSHPNLTVLEAHHNPGFGAGCNRGAAWALDQGAEAIWFLNNDVQVESPHLARLRALAKAHPEVACWSHTQRDRGQRVGADRQPSWFAPPAIPLPPAPVGCRYLDPRESLSGASLYLSREAWQALGPWPEDFFLYYEDAAFSRRAHLLGRPLALLEEAVPHDRGTTTGRRSPLTTFYGMRNLLLLHREAHPEKGLARVGMAFHALQKRFFQGRWGLLLPTWRGAVAGLRNERGRSAFYP